MSSTSKVNGVNHSMQCPICQCELIATDQTYTIDELFQLWRQTVAFSEKIIQSHRQQAESTTLYQCRNCELGIFLPQIIGTPVLYAEYESQSRNQYYSSEKWEFNEGLEDVRGAQSILELGCGNGAFLKKVQTIVPTAIGTEYSPHTLAVARSQGLQVYGLDELEWLAPRRGKFDAVLSFQVLEHVAQPLDFIRDCVEWVRPGGKIGIAVPNSAGIIRHYRQNYLNLPPHHATRWSITSLKALADSLNLEIERVAYEPLCAYHYDYLIHWWYDLLPGDSRIVYELRRIGKKAIQIIIRILKALHIHQLPLRGHTIYVLMSKPMDVDQENLS